MEQTRENSHTLAVWLIGRLLPSYAQGSVFAAAQLKQAVVVFAQDSRERTGPNVILSYTVSSRSV